MSTMADGDLARLLALRRATRHWEHWRSVFTIDAERERPYLWREVRPGDALVVSAHRHTVKQVTPGAPGRLRLAVQLADGHLGEWHVEAALPVREFSVVRYGWEHVWAVRLPEDGPARSAAAVKLDHRGIVTILDHQGREYRMDPMLGSSWTLPEIVGLLEHLRLARGAGR